MQAYDLKELTERMKGIGLELDEENLKAVLPVLMDWIVESAQASENQFDDVLAGLIPAVKPYIMEQVEKIHED